MNVRSPFPPALTYTTLPTHHLIHFANNVPLCSTEVAFDTLDAPPERVTGADLPMPYTSVLEDAAMVKPENIINAVHRVTYRQK